MGDEISHILYMENIKIKPRVPKVKIDIEYKDFLLNSSLASSDSDVTDYFPS